MGKKSTLIVWKTKDGGGDSVVFEGLGLTSALITWSNQSKVPFLDIVSMEVMVKEDN